jgi:hypothetical protein
MKQQGKTRRNQSCFRHDDRVYRIYWDEQRGIAGGYLFFFFFFFIFFGRPVSFVTMRVVKVLGVFKTGN